MHAGAPLNGNPVAPAEKNAEKLLKITHVLMHTCRGIPQLEASCTSGTVARMHAGVPFRSACVKQLKVSTNKLSACLHHACTSRLRAKNTTLRCAVNQMRSITTNVGTRHDVV